MCLAQTPSTGAEYLVYAPSGGSFTVDLSAMPKSRTLAVEWFNPIYRRDDRQRSYSLRDPPRNGSRAPFSGDAVLYLVDTAGHRNTLVSQKAIPC